LNIKEYTEFIRISGVFIDFENTFNSGQAFRWYKKNDYYIGVVNEKIVIIKPQSEDTFDIYNVTPDEYKKYFYWYFDLDKDYADIKDRLKSHDEFLKKAVEKYEGLRLLNQEPFECMISFIISQNNNIKRIQLLIENLCKTYGRKIRYKNFEAYSFPTVEELEKVTVEDLKKLGFGYRAEYVVDAIYKVANDEIKLENLIDLDTEKARNMLKMIKGIGNKVADCILLYSLQKYNVFPINVWVKRALKEYYNFSTTEEIRKFIDSFEDIAGYAHLFLSSFIRNN
jgi:N-glycosylase/DNA lyase